jgi:hypothetical protein
MATIDDLFAQNEKIISLLTQQGFRKEKVSNIDLSVQNTIILNELRDMKKEIRRRKISGVE